MKHKKRRKENQHQYAMRNTIVNVIQPPNLPRSLFHLHTQRVRSKQLALFSTAPPSLIMFMLYHVQQRMWSCDFDEFGLAEDYKKKRSASNIPNHVETCVLPLLSPLLHSFTFPHLPLSYHHTRLDCTCLLGLFLPNQLYLLSPLVSHLS